jgi:hypothetical protein
MWWFWWDELERKHGGEGADCWRTARGLLVDVVFTPGLWLGFFYTLFKRSRKGNSNS